MLNLTVAVINTACVMLVITYLLIRTQTRLNLALFVSTAKKKTLLLLIVLFGFFTIYAGANAIPVNGALVSVRHAGPIIGGLIGGPVVGAGVGLIGVLDRFLQGGLTLTWKSAFLATFLAGVFSGFFVKYRNGINSLTIREGVLFTIGYELFCAGLTFVFSDFATAWKVESQARLPIMIGNAIAVATFLFFMKNLLEEQHNKEIKEQIEYELNVARSIQMSMVPKIFPTFPDVREMEVFACLEPAKEVGGDLYDFFYIDEDRFCFVVGDVSGKGIPASLFMAVTKTLLQARAGLGISPAEVMYHVNNELCNGNDESMFVTVFFGILHIRTGEIEFINAGHTRPFLRKPDGAIRRLSPQQGIAMGIMEEFMFTQEELKLEPGDTLVLYTDGVTEATSAKQELFSEDGLEQSLVKGGGNASAKATTDAIMEGIQNFVGEAPQFDDITILVLRFFGESGEKDQ